MPTDTPPPFRPTHSTTLCALRRALQDHEFVSAKLFESTSRIIEVRVVKREPLPRKSRPKVNEVGGRVVLPAYPKPSSKTPPDESLRTLVSELFGDN